MMLNIIKTKTIKLFNSNYSLPSFIGTAFFGLSVQMFWILASWPASMSRDSLDTWSQIQTGNWDSANAIGYTFLVWLGTIMGQQLWLIIAIQSFLLYFAIFTLLRELASFKFGNLLLINITSVLWMTPLFAPYSVSLWKDSLYASLTVLGATYIAKSEFRNRKVLFMGMGCSILAVTLRPETMQILLLFLLAVSIILILKKTYFRKLIMLWITILSIILLAQAQLMLITISSDAKKAPEWYQVGLELHDLAYLRIVYPESIKIETRKFVDLWSNAESANRAQLCYSTDPVFWYGGFNSEYFERTPREEIRSLWVNEFKRNYPQILENRFCHSKAFIPLPFSSGYVQEQTMWQYRGVHAMDAMTPNNFGLAMNSKTSELFKLSNQWINFWESKHFAVGPGYQLTLLFVTLLFAYRRNVVPTILKGFIGFVILRHIVFLFVSPAQDFRYLITTTLLTYTLFTSTLMNVRHRKTKFLIKNRH